jgi:hypothetical protein
MPQSFVYDLLHQMGSENIVLAYQGEVNTELLESVYSMMNKHLEEKKVSSDRKKKFFYILIESLQNVFHHRITDLQKLNEVNLASAGFIIRNSEEGVYSITTGNYLSNSSVENLTLKLEEVNKLTPDELKNYYRQSLSESELSEKGGAGLGIIEMARKSGHKLDYEFTKINDQYSFFCLTVTIH